MWKSKINWPGTLKGKIPFFGSEKIRRSPVRRGQVLCNQRRRDDNAICKYLGITKKAFNKREKRFYGGEYSNQKRYAHNDAVKQAKVALGIKA